jgi:hypothetical protein
VPLAVLLSPYPTNENIYPSCPFLPPLTSVLHFAPPCHNSVSFSAEHFVDVTSTEAMVAAAGTLDVIIDTTPVRSRARTRAHTLSRRGHLRCLPREQIHRKRHLPLTPGPILIVTFTVIFPSPRLPSNTTTLFPVAPPSSQPHPTSFSR